jgi:hypothetical protein
VKKRIGYTAFLLKVVFVLIWRAGGVQGAISSFRFYFLIRMLDT